MDLSQLASLGPYGGILAALAAFLKWWFMHKKLERRMKKLEDIVNAPDAQPPDVVLNQLKIRFQCWKEDDA